MFISVYILCSVDTDEMPQYMRHFIWVFTVCQCTHLGDTSIQRVKTKCHNFMVCDHKKKEMEN